MTLFFSPEPKEIKPMAMSWVKYRRFTGDIGEEPSQGEFLCETARLPEVYREYGSRILSTREA